MRHSADVCQVKCLKWKFECGPSSMVNKTYPREACYLGGSIYAVLTHSNAVKTNNCDFYYLVDISFNESLLLKSSG